MSKLCSINSASISIAADSRRVIRRRKQALLAAGATAALLIGSSTGFAAEYHVTDETSFRDTLQQIADGTISDPNPVIVLDNDISIGAALLPALNKPVTINTGSHTLSGLDITSNPPRRVPPSHSARPSQTAPLPLLATCEAVMRRRMPTMPGAARSLCKTPPLPSPAKAPLRAAQVALIPASRLLVAADTALC